MIENAYLVLSVKEIRRMLLAARASRKISSSRLGHDAGDKHCIVLEKLRVIPNCDIIPEDSDVSRNLLHQVSSSSVADAVTHIENRNKLG
jgi:hypothetical protein